MKIPGTKIITTDGHVTVANHGELFSFCIQELREETYLTNFLNNLNEHLPKYVFDRNTLATHEDRLQKGLTSKTPLQRARELLQKTHAGRAFDSGEFGEFLLYLFAKEVKGAHKLATKIHARGSDRMTIPGRDNTFALKDEAGDIYMLIGEAKTEPSSNDGLRNAQGDLNTFWSTNKILHEISLASTHIRSEMTPENADLFEAYFIDDHEAHSRLSYKNIILVGYNLEALQGLRTGTISDATFHQQICDDLRRSFTNQTTLIEASPHSSIYCFIPFESIDHARNTFSELNGLTI